MKQIKYSFTRDHAKRSVAQVEVNLGEAASPITHRKSAGWWSRSQKWGGLGSYWAVLFCFCFLNQ